MGDIHRLLSFSINSAKLNWVEDKLMVYFAKHFFKLEGHEIDTDITDHIDAFISRRRFTWNQSFPFSLA